MKKRLIAFLVMLTAISSMHGEDLEGIGVVLTKKANSDVRISGVIANSPAEKAGIQSGSLVLSINGTKTRDLPLVECVQLVRGPAGSSLTLELVNADLTKTNRVVLIREKLQSPAQQQPRPISPIVVP